MSEIKTQSLRPQPSPSISRYDHLSALCRWCGIQWRVDSAHATMEHAILVAADQKDEIERLTAALAACQTYDYRTLADEIERLRAALTQAIEGHNVWESVYGSSPTSRAHLAILETALAPETRKSA